MGKSQNGTQFTRRERYSGKYPKAFREKYKELRGDHDVIEKVKAKGSTPAGQHIPIMLDECLEVLRLTKFNSTKPLIAVDCTLGFGGHAAKVLEALQRRPGSIFIGVDQDPTELPRTESRLRELIPEKSTTKIHIKHLNFANISEYLKMLGAYGQVDVLLADLGFSSMQVDNSSRGFSYKADGPLDMRMNNTPSSQSTTALSLLESISRKNLVRILEENSDETMPLVIANALLGYSEEGKGSSKASGTHSVRDVPKTTLQLRKRVEKGCLAYLKGAGQSQLTASEVKQEVDAAIARTMQALRIEVNQEFAALEGLLDALPGILRPGGGRAAVLTFHSGEDRRVKKSFKGRFKEGVYSRWSEMDGSTPLIRASEEERRNNPRSKCAKLR